MLSIEQHLARIKEEEAAAKLEYARLRAEKLAEFPNIASALNMRVTVLDILGILPLITTLTRKPLEPIAIPGLLKTWSGNAQVAVSRLSGRTYREALDVLTGTDKEKRFAEEGREGDQKWKASILRPQLGEDLEWDNNLRIQLHRGSGYDESHYVKNEWVNLVFDPNNVFDVRSGQPEETIFSKHLISIAWNGLLPATELDQVANSIARGLNDPIRPDDKARYNSSLPQHFGRD